MNDSARVGPRIAKGSPSLSVVIPALNEEDRLPQQLDALGCQVYDGTWEIIVADNGSTDGTIRVANEFAERSVVPCRVVSSSLRRGVNHARNLGVRAATGDVILICDADDLVAPGWVHALAGGLSGFDAVGGALDVLSLNDAEVVKLRGTIASDCLPVSMRFLPYAVGCNCGFQRRAYEEVGGFDESYVGGGDDVAFFWQLQLRGMHLGFVADAIIQYRYRSDRRAICRQQFAFSRSQPRRYRDFRQYGVPRRSRRAILGGWIRLALGVPMLLRSPEGRTKWLRAASRQAGLLIGSFQTRVFYL